MTHTPWGSSQTSHKIAPGVMLYSTASHGGYHLSEGKLLVARAAFPNFQPFAGWPWLEEDCDACLVALLWPEACTPYGVYCSVTSVQKDDYFVACRPWLESPAGSRVRAIAAKFFAENSNNWERGGMGSGPGPKAWRVNFYRIGNHDERISVIFPDYPEKSVYTDEELKAIKWAELV